MAFAYDLVASDVSRMQPSPNGTTEATRRIELIAHQRITGRNV